MRDSKEDSLCRSIPRHSRKLRKLGNVIYYRSFTASTTKPKTLHELPVLRANTQMKFGQRYNTVKKNFRVKFHTPTLLLGRSSSRRKVSSSQKIISAGLGFYLRVDSQIKVWLSCKSSYVAEFEFSC